MFKKLTHAALLTAVAASLSTAALAAPVTYKIDNSHTFPRFSYNHLGYSTQLSRFDKTEGTVVFDQAAKTGEVDITIDVDSVQTGSDTFNGHLKGEKFFDVKQFPTATFKSTKVVFEGDKPASIEGDLTIKGVTKPVTLKVTHFAEKEHPMLKRSAIGADAETVVKRSDFNMGANVPHVSDEVTISIALEAVSQEE